MFKNPRIPNRSVIVLHRLIKKDICKKSMIDSLTSIYSIWRLELEHFIDQDLCVLQTVPLTSVEDEFSSHYLAHQFIICVGFKGRFATDKNIEHDTHTPNVCFLVGLD